MVFVLQDKHDWHDKIFFKFMTFFDRKQRNEWFFAIYMLIEKSNYHKHVFKCRFWKLQKLIPINKPASVREQAPFSPLVLRVKRKPKKASALAGLNENWQLTVLNNCHISSTEHYYLRKDLITYHFLHYNINNFFLVFISIFFCCWLMGKKIMKMYML